MQSRKHGLDPWSGRCPGAGNGNPPQYSCLQNPMDRGAWWATVHRVTKESVTTKRPTTNPEKCQCKFLRGLKIKVVKLGEKDKHILFKRNTSKDEDMEVLKEKR